VTPKCSVTRTLSGVHRLMLWSRRHGLIVDGLLALVLFTGGGVGADHRQLVPRLGFAAVMCGALVVRRRYPVPVFVVVAVTAGAQYVAGTRVQAFDLAILVALYTVAARCSRRDTILAAIVVEVGIIMAAFPWSGRPALGLVGPTVVAAAGAALGANLRVRRAYLAELEARAERLERERDQQAQLAASAERARIARELHDIVAHHVSVMVAQADGASFAIDRDAARARRAMEVVAQTGREALAEMRRLLGVLRPAPGEDEVAPQPGVDQLEELVEKVRHAGLPVELRVNGTPPPMPAGLELAAYRVVQEALTNTMKHGGPNTNARVEVAYRTDGIEIRVADAGPPPVAPAPNRSAGPGQGIVGMRERAAVYGGEIRVGSRPEGGYEVLASFPLEGSSR
jgi:signal transduction histidine kinase